MSVTFVLIVATAALCVLYLLVIATRNHQRFRGPMVVTCPETQQPAAVAVDARHVEFTASVEATGLRLTQCSRWPEHQGCGQECLRQIERAPADCLVRTILSKWYSGKSCALCGIPIGPIHRWEHPPGLIAGDGSVTECTAVPGERLQETLATGWPLCWNCEVAEEFRRRNPDLVIEHPEFYTRTGVHGKVM